jgi:hypothetical protein
MSTFHAVVWIDHQEAHVLMMDPEQPQAQRIVSRGHHKHQGKPDDLAALFADVAHALHGAHEVLLTGPGLARTEFRTWCNAHHPSTAAMIVDNIAADHPSDAQLFTMAKQYFKKFDALQDPASSALR